jgi:hypothetical protein
MGFIIKPIAGTQLADITHKDGQFWVVRQHSTNVRSFLTELEFGEPVVSATLKVENDKVQGSLVTANMLRELNDRLNHIDSLNDMSIRLERMISTQNDRLDKLWKDTFQ